MLRGGVAEAGEQSRETVAINGDATGPRQTCDTRMFRITKDPNRAYGLDALLSVTLQVTNPEDCDLPSGSKPAAKEIINADV